ncbi:hypothetical protein BDN70DRAFT_594111 [Pholiota conissans]|uniref:DUF6533 domain-containing protein n=1 Tax=Pholiota conissans TaxID=109636 RepID=A0A9P6D2K0_9AGAR|nr:hypothetical protein BDN70DRAFT_594111 [Pholiota conissans]
MPYRLMQVGDLISFGALAIQAWELFAHLTDEVEYLWKGRFNFIKALYFCSRYVSLAAQIVNQLLSYGIAIKLEKAGNCSTIFVFKSVIGHAALTMLEIILFIRVYALYKQSLKIKYILAIVYICAASLEIVGNGFVIRSIIQTGGCQSPSMDNGALILFGSGAGFYQIAIFAMSLYKLYDGGLSKTPLTTLMLRDGVIVFVLLTAMMLVLLTYDSLARNLDLAFGKAFLSCFISVISISASSLILNMRKLAVKNTLRSVGYRNTAEGGAERSYITDESICLTSFYE